jgi:aspartyl-tRNA(Asn)/glutamyl-tRNA(Gln) amidotransferase subunit C
MPIDRDDVLKAARLARIELSEQEIERFGDDLSAILDYVAKLDELDLDEVEPQTHATTLAAAFREDEVDQSLTREEALTNAPATEDGHFRVPKVVED